MGLVRPSILVGPAAGPLINPVTLGTGIVLSEITAPWRREVQASSLYQREGASLDDQNPAAQSVVRVRLGATRERQGEILRLVPELVNFFSTDAFHLWVVDDDQEEKITLSNSEVAGSSVTIEYTGTTGTWLADGDYLIVESASLFEDEVVVVSSLDDTGKTFVATIAHNHGAGQIAYRATVCYPNSVLQSIEPSRAPLGKGSLVLTFLTGDRPCYSTSLPA